MTEPSKTKDSNGVALPPPTSLEVRTLWVDGEEFALFEWPAPDAESDAKLTPSEREVLALLAAGSSNQQIAQARGVSVRTVANQVASLLDKLNAASRYELIRRFGHQPGGPSTTRPQTPR